MAPAALEMAVDMHIAFNNHLRSCRGEIVPRPTKKKTLTVRLSPEEKAQAEAVARYLNLPVTTFMKYAAKEAFNTRLPALREAGLWPRLPEPDDNGGES